MQQIFGGTTYVASNNLYQPNQRTRIITVRQHVMDPPSYAKVLCATSFQKDPPPSFSTDDPAEAGGAPGQPTPYQDSAIEYETYLPPAFLVDWQKVTPLVTVPELKQYIKLLGSFSKLLRHAMKGKSPLDADDEANKPFFNQASRDFDAWAAANRASNNGERRTALEADRLPSLEVLMAWHAYTTNPRWYFEDCTRLGKLAPFPLELVTDFIDDETLDYLPPSRIATNVAPCVSELPGVARVTKFTHDLIAVARGDMLFLAGTGLLPSTGVWKGEDGAKLSHAFVNAIMGIDRSSILSSPDPEAKLGSALEWNLFNAFTPSILEDVRARCWKGMNIENSQIDSRIARMKSAYSQESSTSLDLTQAMCEQARYLVKMEALGWLDPGRFDGDPSRLFPLQKAAIRYHAFLHCMSQMQEEVACPTLDIELCWQLHQLKADSYVSDTQRLFKGRLLDQSGFANRAATLHAAFNPTAAAWSKLYGIPYSSCGCYNSDQIDAGKKSLSMKDRIKAKMVGGPNKKSEDSSSNAYTVNMNINEREASHPSSLDFHHRR